MGVKTLPISASTSRSIIAVFFVVSTCSVHFSAALVCTECCSCQGDSKQCEKSGSPQFTFINSVGTVTCSPSSNVCGTIHLMDETNKQPLILKSCFSSSMCSALTPHVDRSIPFYYLGEITARVISVNCCNSDNCNASSTMAAQAPQRLLALALLASVLSRL